MCPTLRQKGSFDKTARMSLKTWSSPILFNGIPKKPLYELEPGVTATNVTASQGILLQIEHLKIEGDLSAKKSDFFAEFVNKILMNPTSKLRTIGLDEVVISSEELELLSAALVNNTTLRTLSSSANRIGDT